MDISKELLEQEKLEFAKLKQKIASEIGLYGLSDDEMESALKTLISMESENFDNIMNDIVLRKYYHYFLNYIFPQIDTMLTLGKTPPVHLKYFEDKQEINEKNRNAINNSLNTYCYHVCDEFIVNSITGHKSPITAELMNLIKKKDIFRVSYNYDVKVATSHPAPAFNYNVDSWLNYASYVQNRLISIDNRLKKRIPAFEQSIEMYEKHVKLYKEYIRKYRFIEVAHQANERIK